MNKFINKCRKERKGFTLVELVIVILIISILAVVLIPQLSSMVNKAKTSGVNEDFHEFQLAAQTVMYENSGIPKNGSGEPDTTCEFLVQALNKNLDKTNEITAGETNFATSGGTTANTDPWGTKYAVVKVTDSDHADAVVGVAFVSNGANQKAGATLDSAKLAGGTVTINYKDNDGKVNDDNLVTVIYYDNGSVNTITHGFSLDAGKADAVKFGVTAP